MEDDEEMEFLVKDRPKMKVEIVKKTIELEAWVESETNKGSYYKVQLDSDGWRCSCPDNSIRGSFCKHITRAKEEVGA